MLLCRANIAGMASGCSCANLVEPSMSVKRKVTVPEGNEGLFIIVLQGYLNGLFHSHYMTS